MRNLSLESAEPYSAIFMLPLDIGFHGAAEDSIDEENDTFRGPHLQLVDRPTDDN